MAGKPCEVRSAALMISIPKMITPTAPSIMLPIWSRTGTGTVTVGGLIGVGLVSGGALGGAATGLAATAAKGALGGGFLAAGA